MEAYEIFCLLSGVTRTKATLESRIKKHPLHLMFYVTKISFCYTIFLKVCKNWGGQKFDHIRCNPLVKIKLIITKIWSLKGSKNVNRP